MSAETDVQKETPTPKLASTTPATAASTTRCSFPRAAVSSACCNNEGSLSAEYVHPRAEGNAGLVCWFPDVDFGIEDLPSAKTYSAAPLTRRVASPAGGARCEGNAFDFPGLDLELEVRAMEADPQAESCPHCLAYESDA